jgi:hypothetical protein
VNPVKAAHGSDLPPNFVQRGGGEARHRRRGAVLLTCGVANSPPLPRSERLLSWIKPLPKPGEGNGIHRVVVSRSAHRRGGPTNVQVGASECTNL